MTLRASLLRELENPNLSVNNRAELCCALAREFEDKGECDEARQMLNRVLATCWRAPKRLGLRAKRGR